MKYRRCRGSLHICYSQISGETGGMNKSRDGIIHEKAVESV